MRDIVPQNRGDTQIRTSSHQTSAWGDQIFLKSATVGPRDTTPHGNDQNQF